MTDRRRVMYSGNGRQTPCACSCPSCSAATSYSAQVEAAERVRQEAQSKTCNVPVMAYVPWQEWNGIYEEMVALCKGTIFEALDKPFLGKRGCCNG